MPAIDPYSVTSFPIELLSETGASLGIATGFYYQYDSDIYLVTNWHVLSGRHPHNGQPKHSQGAIPHTVRMPIHKEKVGDWFEFITYLYDSNGKPLWIQHPAGQKVDIALYKINIDEIEKKVSPEKIIFYPINKIKEIDNVGIQIGQDVFILGFPLGIMKTAIFPIWKRGTIATEPAFNIDDYCFLVDTATKEGMSGSPVIFRGSTYPSSEGGFVLSSGYVSQFLGIYSGRYGKEGEGLAQLGIVWKKEVIHETISHPKPGNYELITT